TAAAEPCASNADCPTGVSCGGTRCASGANNGAPCAAASECPGSACTRPGTPYAPNACDDAHCTEIADEHNVAHHGLCEAGPFETFCGPTATFKGCLDDTDCAAYGETCSVGRLRECFPDNG